MNPSNNIFKGPLVWILAAGVLIGAGTTATVLSSKGTPSTYKSPAVTIDTPKPISRTSSSNMEMVKALDESFANLADAVKPAVVHIRVQNAPRSGALGQRQVMGGEGSGFIFRPDGYIITNDHVAGGFDKVTVILYDGREFEGKVIRAEDSDLAVVKIDADNLPTLPLANSNNVRSGEFAMAVGAPFGLDNTVTVGHISATQRTNQIPDPNTGKRRLYWDLVQTDTPINMGNSGGPLVNIEGEVVGVNTAIFSPTGTSGGIGFAISSNQARLLAETLIANGKVTRGYLGIAPENLKIYQQKQLGIEKGAIVAELPSDGPAAMAGVQKGDVVVRVSDVPIESQVDIRNAMIKYGPGSKVEVEVVRNKQRKVFSVTAKEPPAQPAVQQTPNVRRGEIPEDFKIDEIPGFKDFPRIQTPFDTPKSSSGPRLGVSVEDVTDTARKQYSLPKNASGAVVTSVMPDSIADRAKLRQGDIIVQIGDAKVTDADSLVEAMRSVKKGDRKSVKFVRHGSGSSSIEQTVDVTFE